MLVSARKESYINSKSYLDKSVFFHGILSCNSKMHKLFETIKVFEKHKKRIDSVIIDKVNKLYDDGNTIYIYTARGMGQFNGDLVKVYNSLYVITLDSLKKWRQKPKTWA